MIHDMPTVHPYLIGYRDCAGNITPKDEIIPMTEDSLVPDLYAPLVTGKFLCQPGECQFDEDAL